jgi:hypothetical protein
MDLQEWVKKWNVWKLESEAFKKPIEIKIWYDNSDIKKFEDKIDELKKSMSKYALADKHDLLCEEMWKCHKHAIRYCQDIEHSLWDTNYKLEQHIIDFHELYKVIADLKTTVETLSGTILQLQKKNKEIEKKLTVQPRVFNDKIFISWREEVMLGLYDIPDWDYLCITSLRIWEHNEYVNNKDEVLIDKIHVEDWFTPRYQLYWGTELDTPTATVYYTLLLMPI